MFLLILPLAMILGCANKELLPYLGKWEGGFVVSENKGIEQLKPMSRYNVDGFVQIYATGKTFVMEVSTQQQALSIKGKWELKGNDLTLSSSAVQLDDQGGYDNKNPNLVWIESSGLVSHFQRPIILRLSEDKKSLQGLQNSFSGLSGRMVWKRDSRG